MKLDLLSDAQVASLNQLIDAAQHIIVCAHKSPDGDALGAVLAWGEFLRKKGKETMLVVPDAYPDFLKWMPGNERVLRYDKKKDIVDQAFKQADLVFCLDFNNPQRVLDMQQVLEESKAQKVMIDHHEDPLMDEATIFSFPKMSSTCELLFRIIWQLGEFERAPRSMAICLYTGMMTDTGGFTYNSSRPEIFTIIGLLLTKGFDKDKIFRNVYNQLSESCIRMRGFVMSQKLTVVQGSHACYYTLTKEEMKRFHFLKGDAEGLVNEPLKIKGMRLSISLREDTEKENIVWVSLRSVDHYYCNKLAELFFGGGGHKNAAGGKVVGTIEDAEQITLKAILYFATHEQ